MSSRHDQRLLIRRDYGRARLDRGVDLMQRALELREQLEWGIFDLDEAIAEVRAFKGAVAQYRKDAS